MIQPVQRRERDEPERVRQGRNRQQGAQNDDDYGSQDERSTGPALDERDLVGTDDMDDQSLGEERSEAEFTPPKVKSAGRSKTPNQPDAASMVHQKTPLFADIKST